MIIKEKKSRKISMNQRVGKMYAVAKYEDEWTIRRKAACREKTKWRISQPQTDKNFKTNS